MRRAYLLLAFLLVPRAHGAELTLSALALHLPDSSYHYLATSVRARFASQESETAFFLEGGLTPPFSRYGYTQTIAFLAGGKEWKARLGSFASLFFGLGLGAYADEVSGSQGIVPSIMTQSGLKLGGQSFGVVFTIEGFIGIYSLPQLFAFTAWPLSCFAGGIYVGL